jgi:hypothetical protein
MVDATLNRAWELKQALLDFVYDAEGDLAAALETYAADRSRTQKGSIPQGLIVDAFLTEGNVNQKTPIDLFLESESELSAADRQLVQSWQRTFTGLFAIEQVLADGFQAMNWLTAKHYTIKPASEKDAADLARLKLGEIVLTRIAPVTDAVWMIAAPYQLLGKLGKPKLAVAIGNFRDNHKPSLYSDAPDLLEEAWRSVEKHHQAFLDFFGSDEITMSGYELNKKLPDFQELLIQRQLAEAGVDQSKSIADLVAESGMDEAEMAAAAAEAGVDAAEVANVLANAQSGSPAKMMAPQVQLPDTIKKAEQVTVLADSRWGQMLLPNHTKLKAVLEAEDWRSVEYVDKLIRQYLEDPSVTLFVWQRLTEQYPQQLESILQSVLQRPDLQIPRDLPTLLAAYGKPSEPELPEIASVPLHLHNLFEEAIVEVNKSKSKGKSKPKKSGFGAP